jgi:phenylalanine-4-hydroxylase
MSDNATDSMTRQPTAYAPLIKINDGNVSVILSEDHPGHGDERYIEHREWIAAAAMFARPGDSAPHIVYSDSDHWVWRLVTEELHDLHRRHASSAYLESLEALSLPSRRLPQLRDVSDTIEKATGFRMIPAPGIVECRTFYESLADRDFRATQYIRHASRPRFSPEPDMIHEIIGHGAHLMTERWAHLYQLAGDAVRRLRNPAVVELVSRIFWFCMECGLVDEDGEIKVWGASLLTSSGELMQFQNANIKPLDLAEMSRQDYKPDAYQRVLFAAKSQVHLEDFLDEFFTTVKDDSPYAVQM